MDSDVCRAQRPLSLMGLWVNTHMLNLWPGVAINNRAFRCALVVLVGLVRPGGAIYLVLLRANTLLAH